MMEKTNSRIDQMKQFIDKKTFEIELNYQPDTVFVYGKKVNNFLNIDYEAVSMLNVSATQEIIKRIEVLQNENNSIKKENEILKNKIQEIDNLKKRIELLENK